jgi:isopentenyl diphosphate isomerase/L-lactate dehydrogenase-like FMN-dependent dehydrogenase
MTGMMRTSRGTFCRTRLTRTIPPRPTTRLVSGCVHSLDRTSFDLILAHTENVRAFSRFFFHPRVLRAVSRCDPSTKILGCKSSLPIFVSPAALAKLGHPLGETNITRGAGRTGIVQIVSTNASFSASEIAAARVSPTQPLFFQLYKKRDDSEAEKLVKEVETLGYDAIFLTVDAMIAGRRDRDIKASFVLEDQEGGAMKQQPSAEDPKEEEGVLLGTAGALVAASDVDMTWERVGLFKINIYPEGLTYLQTIPWLRSVTKLPIVIKGEVYLITIPRTRSKYRVVGIQCVAVSWCFCTALNLRFIIISRTQCWPPKLEWMVS